MSRLTPEHSAAVSRRQKRLNFGGARLRNFLKWRSKRRDLTRPWIRCADRLPSRCPRKCHPLVRRLSPVRRAKRLPVSSLPRCSGQASHQSLITNHPPLHLSPRPWTQITQPQSADTNPDQTQGGVTDRSSHPAHLPVLSFIKNDA